MIIWERGCSTMSFDLSEKNHHYKFEQECEYFIENLSQVQQQFIAKLIASKGLSVKGFHDKKTTQQNLSV